MGEAVRSTVKAPDTKKENQVSQTQKGNFHQQVSSPVEQILFLQRTIGNRAVERFLKSGALQAKLRIGAPGDIYEQEADRVADLVMRMPEAVSNVTPSIQRACPNCENDEMKRQPIKEEEEEEKLQRLPVEEEEEKLQPKATSGSISEVNPNIESHIQSVKGGGKPLSASERAFFEPRFGADFGNVRVHNDTRAAYMARSVNARAFTIGQDIVFGAGQYSSWQGEGRCLLAHELTHVVQQRGRISLQRSGEGEQERPTFEFFNLSGVLESKENMERRLNDLAEFTQLGIRVGDVARRRLLAYSSKYRLAYQNYASAVHGAREEAQNQNMWLGVVIGVACNAAAAFILPSTAAGWFALTAAETATALASGTGQALVGAGLSSVLRFSGGDLEPGGLSPEAQQLPIWRTVASLYRNAATQVTTIRKLHRIVAGAQFLIGEIRTQVAGGLPTMTEEQVVDRVEALILGDQAMSHSDDEALNRGIRDIRRFEADLNALSPESYSIRRMEQDIWILWMGTLSDASVLDLDAIEDRLHAVGVLGPGSRLGIDFGDYTFYWEEDEARDRASAESDSIREASRLPQMPHEL